MIKNGEQLDKKIIRQYQTVDYNTIKTYTSEYQQQITSSIFRNINRNDLNVNNRTIKEIKTNLLGEVNFLKNVEMIFMLLVGR